MLSLLRNPVNELAKANRSHSYARTLSILIVSSVLFAIGGFLMTSAVLPTSTAFAYFSATGLFFMTIIASIILSVVVVLIANTISGKQQTYYHGITSVSYSIFPGSIGFLIMGLSVNVPFGLFIGIVLAAIFVSLGLSIFFKSLKEFFRLDSASALSLLLIAVVAFAVSFFSSTAFLGIVNALLQL
ncbi:MAG: hypothetical protein HY513_04385 [Candidatus Aenigmarchaeota archaeon]|nr:hypothetical protein [Candidatus Aenigmarchaeota archaeon]